MNHNDPHEHPTQTSVDSSRERVSLSDEQWRHRLSPERYRVLRQHGTERAFTGQYYDHHDAGVYRCAGCDAPLFDSRHKYNSGTGWPSFDRALTDRVETELDRRLRMPRTEVHCARCGGHLGHVFNDGPRASTGKRYCINSLALAFESRE